MPTVRGVVIGRDDEASKLLICVHDSSVLPIDSPAHLDSETGVAADIPEDGTLIYPASSSSTKQDPEEVLEVIKLERKRCSRHSRSFEPPVSRRVGQRRVGQRPKSLKRDTVTSLREFARTLNDRDVTNEFFVDTRGNALPMKSTGHIHHPIHAGRCALNWSRLSFALINRRTVGVSRPALSDGTWLDITEAIRPSTDFAIGFLPATRSNRAFSV